MTITPDECIDELFFPSGPRVLEIYFRFRDAAVMVLAKTKLERHDGFEVEFLPWFPTVDDGETCWPSADTVWAEARVRTIKSDDDMVEFLWDVLDLKGEDEIYIDSVGLPHSAPEPAAVLAALPATCEVVAQTLRVYHRTADAALRELEKRGLVRPAHPNGPKAAATWVMTDRSAQ
jgi:hypothetical protein